MIRQTWRLSRHSHSRSAVQHTARQAQLLQHDVQQPGKKKARAMGGLMPTAAGVSATCAPRCSLRPARTRAPGRMRRRAHRVDQDFRSWRGRRRR